MMTITGEDFVNTMEVVTVSPAERDTRGLERIVQPAMSTVANAFWLVAVDVVRNFGRFGNGGHQRSEMTGSRLISK
jgi:hypothetical protein